MAKYTFGEKTEEYDAKTKKKLPVWKTPRYEESKRKAIENIESGKYGIEESDFWILMNATKTGKMAYTGLIISHNGCLKINDKLESKFDPACVSVDKEGYNNSLVYQYCNPEQGLYEVGEVSNDNLKNNYPYAMAYKRLFDRVVLKLSKLAYSGIYSDSESDEFSQRIEAPINTEPVQGETLPAYIPKKATKAQLKQIQEAAGGDIELVKHVLGLFGYQSSKDVEGEKVQAILGTIRQKVAG